MKTAVFPGSFDPFTKGHIDIVQRSLPLFDKVIIGIGNNASKKYLFSFEQRKRFIEVSLPNHPKIEIKAFNTLTAHFCKKNQARYIIRGLRNLMDFEYEKNLCYVNTKLNPEIEHVFLLTTSEYAVVSSSLVRDIVANRGDLSFLVSEAVAKMLYA